MSHQSAKVSKQVGKLTVGSGGLSLTKGTVSQASTFGTGVELNASAGVITTVTADTAGAASTTIIVTNNKVTASSVVVASIVSYAGTFITNGVPILSVSAIASGSFTLRVANQHASNSLSGIMKISFIVV